MSNTYTPLLGIPTTGPALHRVWMSHDKVGRNSFGRGPRGEFALRTKMQDDEGSLWLVQSNGWHPDLKPYTEHDLPGLGRRRGGIPLELSAHEAEPFNHPMIQRVVTSMNHFVPEEMADKADFSGLEFEDFGHIARWHCQATLRDDVESLHAKLWLDVESGSPIIQGTLLLSPASYRGRQGTLAPAGEIGCFDGNVSLTFGEDVVLAMPLSKLTMGPGGRGWSALGSKLSGPVQIDFGSWVVVRFVLAPNPGVAGIDDEEALWLQNAARWGNRFVGMPETPDQWLGETPVSNRAAAAESVKAIDRFEAAIASGASLLTDDRPFTPYNAGGQAGSQPHLGATFSAHLWDTNSRANSIGFRRRPEIVEAIHWAALEKLLRPEKCWEPGRPGRLWRASDHPLLRYDDGQPHRRGSDTLQFPGADGEALPRFSRFGNYANTPDTHREEEVVVSAAKLTGCPALRLYLEHWVEGFLASGRLKDGYAQIPRASGRRVRSFLNSIDVTRTAIADDGVEDLLATWTGGDLYEYRDQLWTPAVDAWTDDDGNQWWSPYEHAQMLHAATRLAGATSDRRLHDCIERLTESVAASLVRSEVGGRTIWILPYHCQVITKAASTGDEPAPAPPQLTPNSPEVKIGGSNWLAWGGCGIVGALGTALDGSSMTFINPVLLERLVEAHDFLKAEGTVTGTNCNYALVEEVS